MDSGVFRVDLLLLTNIATATLFFLVSKNGSDNGLTTVLPSTHDDPAGMNYLLAPKGRSFGIPDFACDRGFF